MIDRIRKIIKEELLKHGLGDNKSFEDIAKLHGVDLDSILNQAKMGYKVEREHTDNLEEIGEIVRDHLVEDPKYYLKLKKSGL